MTVLTAAGGALADPVPAPEPPTGPPEAPQDDHGPIDDLELPEQLDDLVQDGPKVCYDESNPDTWYETCAGRLDPNCIGYRQRWGTYNETSGEREAVQEDSLCVDPTL